MLIKYYNLYANFISAIGVEAGVLNTIISLLLMIVCSYLVVKGVFAIVKGLFR